MKIKSLLLSTLLLVACEGGTKSESETKEVAKTLSTAQSNSASSSEDRLFRYMPEKVVGALYLSVQQKETREHISKLTDQIAVLKSQQPEAAEVVELLQELCLGDAGFERGLVFVENLEDYAMQASKDKNLPPPVSVVSQFADAKKALTKIKNELGDHVKCSTDEEDASIEVCKPSKEGEDDGKFFLSSTDNNILISLTRDGLLSTKGRDNANYSLTSASLTNYFKTEAGDSNSMIVFASDALRELGRVALENAQKTGDKTEQEKSDFRLMQELAGEIKGVSKYSDQIIKSNFNFGVDLAKIDKIPVKDPNFAILANIVKGFGKSNQSGSALEWSQVSGQTALGISLDDNLIDSLIDLVAATEQLPPESPFSFDQLRNFKGLFLGVANQGAGVPAVSIVTKLGSNEPAIVTVLEKLFTDLTGDLGKMQFQDIEVEGAKFRSLTTPFGIGVNIGIHEGALIISTSANGAGDIIKSIKAGSPSQVISQLSSGDKGALFSVYWDPQRTLAAINSVEATASMFTGGQPLMGASDKENLKNTYPSLFDFGYSDASKSFFVNGNSFTKNGYETITQATK